ncbi:hypothetical protein E2562_002418 [Oryza meyeriana var. granulata]|uniref:Uncharacterized protein n=1 Tax=Oryza meyeriana var. granulata TaxID=110450 RepID=A0A6G1F2B3_9ORYZ|nr:hypothetical protein E2562_002418 [Oryza meyeriana var. granulata]
MAAAAAAARSGLIPGGKTGGHGLRSPGKPVALADITNTGRPNPPGSVHAVADVLKENAKLRHLLAERTKVIEVSRIEMQKVRFALQSMQQKNLQLVQELNQGKDRDIKARPSKRAPAEAHQKATGAITELPPSVCSSQLHSIERPTKLCSGNLPLPLEPASGNRELRSSSTPPNQERKRFDRLLKSLGMQLGTNKVTLHMYMKHMALEAKTLDHARWQPKLLACEG